MSFDFFNTSYLAFGSKLTAAFITLNRLAEEAENNIEQVYKDQEIFNQYLNRNYLVPKPNSPDAPCRSDEFFDLMNDKEIYIRKIIYDNNKLEVKLTAFNRTNNRITKLSGSTKIKEGYACYKEAVSNIKHDRTIEFVEKQEDIKGIVLFQYRIDKEGNINLVGSVANMSLVPFDISQYNGMEKGATLATNSAKYTSNDYQAVCIVGTLPILQVNLNGKLVMGNTWHLNNQNKRHCILYLKPDDIITGTYDSIFRINYTQT